MLCTRYLTLLRMMHTFNISLGTSGSIPSSAKFISCANEGIQLCTNTNQRRDGTAQDGLQHQRQQDKIFAQSTPSANGRSAGLMSIELVGSESLMLSSD